MSQISHRATTRRFVTVSGWLIAIILIPLLLLNLSIIIQTAIHPEQLPTAFGHKALILLPDSGDGHRSVGIIRTINPKDLQPQDTIAYRQEHTFFIERVGEVITDDGQLSIRTTSGSDMDAMLTQVPPSQIEGILVRRIPRLGGWALFMQTPVGMLLFMILPVCLFLLHDSWQRRKKPAYNASADHLSSKC